MEVVLLPAQNSDDIREILDFLKLEHSCLESSICKHASSHYIAPAVEVMDMDTDSVDYTSADDEEAVMAATVMLLQVQIVVSVAHAVFDDVGAKEGGNIGHGEGGMLGMFDDVHEKQELL